MRLLVHHLYRSLEELRFSELISDFEFSPALSTSLERLFPIGLFICPCGIDHQITMMFCDVFCSITQIILNTALSFVLTEVISETAIDS